MLPKMIDNEVDEFDTEQYPEYDELTDNLCRSIMKEEKKKLKVIELHKGERRLMKKKL